MKTSIKSLFATLTLALVLFTTTGTRAHAAGHVKVYYMCNETHVPLLVNGADVGVVASPDPRARGQITPLEVKRVKNTGSGTGFAIGDNTVRIDAYSFTLSFTVKVPSPMDSYISLDDDLTLTVFTNTWVLATERGNFVSSGPVKAGM